MRDAQLTGCNGFYGRHTLERFIAAQSRLGRRQLSLYPVPAHLWLDHIRCIGLEELRRALDAAESSVASFHPENLQYSLFEEEGTLRGACSAAYYRGCVDAAAALECRTLCVRPSGSLLDRDPEVQWRALEQNVAKLCGYAGQKGICVCVQTVSGEEGRLLQTAEELARLLEVVPEAYAVLDTVPVSQAGESIPQWFALFGRRIRHVRFWDGRADGGRIWGEGVYPSRIYACQLRKAGYAGPVSLCGVTDRYQDAPEIADAENLARAGELLCDPKGED